MSDSAMLLRTSETSPFGRKVRIVAKRLGLDAALTLAAVDPADESDPIRKDNPLGKMPCLVLCDGRTLYDSAVIIEYLDHLSGGKLLPAPGDDRFADLTEQALFDGLMDAAVSIVVERRFRPEEHVSPSWMSHQRGKVERALAKAERDEPKLTPPGVGAISLACALGYLDWRNPYDWRSAHPSLVDWLERFRAAVPEFDATQHDH